MTDFLRCIRCKNFPSKPYECHECGYLHCLSCLKTSDICGTCKKSSKYKHSKLADLLISNEPVTCNFCSLKVNKQQIKLHKMNSCPCAIFKCTKKGCNIKGDISEIINHIKEIHEQDLISLFRDKKPKDKNTSRLESAFSNGADFRSQSVIIPNNSETSKKTIGNMKSESTVEKTDKYHDKKEKDCCIF